MRTSGVSGVPKFRLLFFWDTLIVHCLVNADSDGDMLGLQESGKGLHIFVVLHIHVEVSGDPGEWVRLAGHPGSSSRKKVRSREIFKTYKTLSEMC